MVLRAPVYSKKVPHVTLSYTRGEIDEFVRGDRAWRETDFNFRESGGATDISRVVASMEIKKWVSRRHFERTLLVNEGDMANPYLISDQIDISQYKNKNGHTTGDIHRLSHEYPGDTYDMIYVPQTLEHCHSPREAIGEIHKLLRPGGATIWTVPFITRPHMTPVFYQTFSSNGLDYLFREVGFRSVDIRCWGNDEYVTHVLVDRIWPKIHDMPDFSSGPSPNRYAQCIVFAIK